MSTDTITTMTTVTREQMHRALDRAHDQARLGNVPTLLAAELLPGSIHETWQVRSRSTDGIAYTVELLHAANGIATQCDCPAAAVGRCCWHRGAARLAHQDAIPCHNAAGVRMRPRPNTTLATITAGFLSGKRAAS